MESKSQDNEGIHSRTRSRNTNVEQKAGPNANNGDTLAVSDHEANTSLSRTILNVNSNVASSNSDQNREFRPRTPASEVKATSVSNNNNNNVARDPGRIIALQQQVIRTENRLTTLSSAVDEIKESQLHFSIDVMSTRNEILDNMRARDTQLTDLLTQQNASFDTKYNDSLAAIANIASMIAASNTNNNNNNSTNNNDTNARPRAVTTDTPYTSEVDFVPVTPQVPTNTIQSGMELFPPSGRDQPVTLLSALGPEPTNIKLEHTDDQQPIWYGAPSGTLFPNVTGDIPVWSPDPSVRALIAEQAKALDQYKAMAAHSAHLRQQSEERRSPLTDRKAPTVMGMQQTLMSSSTQRPINPDDRRQPLADLKVPSDTFTAPNVSNRGQPQASAPAQSPASEGANTANEGSIRSLQEQLNIIQEILMARDSKEMKSNAPPKNTKV